MRGCTAVNVYVGITDWSWYDYLRDHSSEVNFWKPGGCSFKAISEGDVFFFKMKAAHSGKIASGEYFTKYLTMTVEWAWRAFGDEDGVVSPAQLSEMIAGYRSRMGTREDNPKIGCIILNDVLYFDQKDWFNAPGSWRTIVTGKTFRPDNPDTKWLLDRVEIRPRDILLEPLADPKGGAAVPAMGERYTESLTKHRLGQGAFRVFIADAYHDRCAITGERTMPVLQAAHIKPYAQDGPHAVSNGLFLRSDTHTLFDAGYPTITPNTIHASRRVHDDFGNGRIYYAYQGKQLAVVPDASGNRPAKDYLEWHNDCVYLG